MFTAGTAVESEDLLPGDLVFFTYNEDKSASYVGIYLGDGQFIAENNEKQPVRIQDMTLDYYKEIYIGARRMSAVQSPVIANNHRAYSCI
jgi:cell wall-associated NlpC family hydrolase